VVFIEFRARHTLSDDAFHFDVEAMKEQKCETLNIN
jgi:hypothetical protein